MLCGFVPLTRVAAIKLSWVKFSIKNNQYKTGSTSFMIIIYLFTFYHIENVQ